MVSIVNVVERTGLRLNRVGHNYNALCPLHFDKDTPSFYVFPRTNSWCCFGGCEGKGNRRNGGDSIEFIRQRYKFNYRQAKQWIDDNFSFNIKTELPVLEIKPPRPVPPEFIVYWHKMVKRDYFHSRGFTDRTIDREMFGWDGYRYCIPVWEGQPQFSECLGVRKRKVDGTEGPKYIGLKESNFTTVWGRWYCQHAKIILAFAGELDACLAYQDGFPSFSVVNGIGSIEQFPPNWPELWFPDSQQMIVIFDKKEEVWAGRLANKWNRFKGTMQARVFHWLETKDYGEFRKDFSSRDFQELVYKQLGVRLDV